MKNVKIDFLPHFDVPALLPRESDLEVLRLGWLAGCRSTELCDALRDFISEFEGWFEQQQVLADEFIEGLWPQGNLAAIAILSAAAHIEGAIHNAAIIGGGIVCRFAHGVTFMMPVPSGLRGSAFPPECRRPAAALPWRRRNKRRSGDSRDGPAPMRRRPRSWSFLPRRPRLWV